MKNHRITAICLIILSSSMLFISACCPKSKNSKNLPIIITDVKTATGINEDLMPVKIQDTFPKNTSKVYCWFKWRGARVNTVILAKWHYVTDDIPILDNAVVIPRKEGTGSISLVMPEGKTLPMGLYRIDLTLEGQPLKTLSFKVE